ncbi:MAG: hypothetical protein A3K90_05340 [Pelodictyon luteolum]|uniref:Uncharacterized protein n=1 Tax=Pelodictyon luteolum TaxID=1100 RepID=A0A165MEB2_PELLU|nr:hypothetical protein [Pelodictyon luteolum]KZK75146.1 MAG: hypothetical protein A3K90_05340 [Pelodictyon luteolum]
MTTRTIHPCITPYGGLEGIEFRDLASNSRMDGGFIAGPQILKTPFGDVVPQFETEDMGRRTLKPLCFYKDGTPKSIPLQTRTMLMTPIGPLSAELVTFYPSGALKRVFPLDGKLSGFWSWQNELKLAEKLSFDSPQGALHAKVIAFRFYESGALKSLTLWPGESLAIMTPLGMITARKGVSFYENGAVGSLEPLKKTMIETPIGAMRAYDSEPNGIHGDTNSLQFTQDGSIKGLSTVDEAVEVSIEGVKEVFRPGLKNNVCGDERKVKVPMHIRFRGERVFINSEDGEGFSVEKCRATGLETLIGADEPSYSCGG